MDFKILSPYLLLGVVERASSEGCVGEFLDELNSTAGNLFLRAFPFNA